MNQVERKSEIFMIDTGAAEGIGFYTVQYQAM